MKYLAIGLWMLFAFIIGFIALAQLSAHIYSLACLGVFVFLGAMLTSFLAYVEEN